MITTIERASLITQSTHHFGALTRGWDCKVKNIWVLPLALGFVFSAHADDKLDRANWDRAMQEAREEQSSSLCQTAIFSISDATVGWSVKERAAAFKNMTKNRKPLAVPKSDEDYQEKKLSQDVDYEVYRIMLTTTDAPSRTAFTHCTKRWTEYWKTVPLPPYYMDVK